MEALPVDLFRQAENPGLNNVQIGRVEAEAFCLIIEEFNADFSRKNIVRN